LGPGALGFHEFVEAGRIIAFLKSLKCGIRRFLHPCEEGFLQTAKWVLAKVMVICGNAG